MALLTTLKLVAAKRSNNASPVVQRRNKLGKKLYEQIQLATAQAEGRVYAPTKLKTLTNKETGERTSVEAAKRIKAWWWVAETGSVAAALYISVPASRAPKDLSLYLNALKEAAYHLSRELGWREASGQVPLGLRR